MNIRELPDLRAVTDEEFFYGFVGEELQRGMMRKGLWIKALAETGMDESKVRAEYIKLRTHQLRSRCRTLPKLVSRALALDHQLSTLEQRLACLSTETKNIKAQIVAARELAEKLKKEKSQYAHVVWKTRTIPVPLIALAVATLVALLTWKLGNLFLRISLSALAGMISFGINWRFVASRKPEAREYDRLARQIREAEVELSRLVWEVNEKEWSVNAHQEGKRTTQAGLDKLLQEIDEACS
jgi:septal ring factor EnvC (AmiA/AmiB activator)